MNLQPRFEALVARRLIGLNIRMSMANNLTGELWKSLMPRRDEISSRKTHDLISLQLFAPDHFINFSPSNEFVKWAGAFVEDSSPVPQGMSVLKVPGGSYAVFDYKGPAFDSGVFQYIFQQWLPSSGHQLDDRPHFEVLGAKYSNTNPDSEEEIWIPIK